MTYTQRNFSEFLLNQPEIRLYLPFPDWFGSKRTSVWIQINRNMVNTIWFQVNLIRLRKNVSVCNHSWLNMPCLKLSRYAWASLKNKQCYSIINNSQTKIILSEALFSYKFFFLKLEPSPLSFNRILRGKIASSQIYIVGTARSYKLISN